MVIAPWAVIEDGWYSLEGFVCGGGGRGLLIGSHKLNREITVKIFINNWIKKFRYL